MFERIQPRVLVAALALCLIPAGSSFAGSPATGTESPSQPDKPPPETAERADVMHLSPARWEAGKEQVLRARVDEPWKLKRLWAHVRPMQGWEEAVTFADFETICSEIKQARWRSDTHGCEIPLLQESPRVFGAVVPASLVQPPGLRYHVASEGTDGAQSEHFATAQSPHPVLVVGETDRSERQEKLARHGGRRNRIELKGDVTFFGSARHEDFEGAHRTDQFSDYYGGGELIYTHRVLKMLYAFRIGFAYMRGQRPTFDRADGTAASVGHGDQPGLVYGFGDLDFEFHRWFSMALRIALGASAEEFSGGVGLLLRVGPHYATHAELGFDWMHVAGARGWLKFAWDTIPYVPMALTIELTEFPEADWSELALRALLDINVQATDEFSIGLRVGYAKRTSSHDGGFVAGMATSVEF